MSKPILYYALFSPPSRAVMQTAKIIDLDLDLRVVDFSKKEHLSETFCTINPHHTVPTLIDDGEVIWDSHAIMSYLVSKYATSDSLYPNDLVIRAKIDQCFHFDTAVIFSGAITSFVKTILYGGKSELQIESLELTHKAYDYTERLLKDDYLIGNNLTLADISCCIDLLTLDKSKTILYGGKSELQIESLELTHKAYDYTERLLKDDYLIGNNLTLADISCCIDLLTLDKLVPIDKNKYPKLATWIERVTTIPNFHDINDEGVQQLQSRFESYLEANKLISS